jgi:hypothetical protein
MSYNYFVTPQVLISEKLQKLKYELDTSHLPLMIEALASHHSLLAEPVWHNGAQALEVHPTVKSPEHEGIGGLVERLQHTLFRFADAGTYTVTDEHGERHLVTVA